MKSIQEIRDSLIGRLKSNKVIKDSAYVGSNISILVDILAYVKYNISFTTVSAIKEVLLPTTSNYNNAVLFAKNILGYNIIPPTPAKSILTIKAKPESTLPLSIPANTKIDGGDNHQFLLKDDVIISSHSKEYKVEIFEGTVVDRGIDSDNTLFEINDAVSELVIPYSKIIKDGFIVKKNGLIQKQVFNLLDLADNTFLVEHFIKGKEWSKLIFSYVGYGNNLKSGDVVDVQFIITKGVSGNGISEFKPKEDLGYDIISSGESYGGTDIESLDSIKENAPKRYNTGVVAVTKSDYETILEEHNLIKTAVAWGGEDEYPQQLGHINIAPIPQDSKRRVLGPEEEASIITFLHKRRVISTIRNLTKPQYIYMDMDINIVGKLQSNNLIQKQNEIKKIVSDYFDKELRGARSIFFEATLINKIGKLFEDENYATPYIKFKPKLLMNYVDSSYKRKDEGDSVRTYIPNAIVRYKMAHHNDPEHIIDLPDDSTAIADLLNNGWKIFHHREEPINISFSGRWGSKAISSTSTTMNIPSNAPALYNLGFYAEVTEALPPNKLGLDKDIMIDGKVIGRFSNMLSCIIFDTKVIRDNKPADSEKNDFFIDMDYSPYFNVVGVNNSYFKLGTIEFK